MIRYLPSMTEPITGPAGVEKGSLSLIGLERADGLDNVKPYPTLARGQGRAVNKKIRGRRWTAQIRPTSRGRSSQHPGPEQRPPADVRQQHAVAPLCALCAAFEPLLRLLDG